MSDGAIYDIPADIIAEHRAGYLIIILLKTYIPRKLIQPRLYAQKRNLH